MASRKADEADEDPTDAAARGDTPLDPEKARHLDEIHNLRNEVNRLNEENQRLRGQGTQPPADDGDGGDAGKSRTK